MPNPLRHYNDCACGKRKARKSDLCRHCSQIRRHQGIPIGTPFGKLSIDSPPERTSDGTYYVCKCECGNHRRVRFSELKAGVRGCKTCGAEQRRDSISRALTHTRRPLNPLQAFLYAALCKRPAGIDHGVVEIEREAYAIASASQDPLADFKLFFQTRSLETRRGCSLSNSNRPDCGRRRAMVRI